MSAPRMSTNHQSSAPRQSLAQLAILVRDYDEAIAFYVGVLGFSLIEDTPLPQEKKRWVVVAPPGARESKLLLARAASPEQQQRIGNQTGGRVFLFLHTDNFRRDYDAYRASGVTFLRPSSEEPYGTVAVFVSAAVGRIVSTMVVACWIDVTPAAVTVADRRSATV